MRLNNTNLRALFGRGARSSGPRGAAASALGAGARARRRRTSAGVHGSRRPARRVGGHQCRSFGPPTDQSGPTMALWTRRSIGMFELVSGPSTASVTRSGSIPDWVSWLNEDSTPSLADGSPARGQSGNAPPGRCPHPSTARWEVVGWPQLRTGGLNVPAAANHLGWKFGSLVQAAGQSRRFGHRSVRVSPTARQHTGGSDLRAQC